MTIGIWEPIVGHNKLFDRFGKARESEGSVVVEGAAPVARASEFWQKRSQADYTVFSSVATLRKLLM